MGNGGPISMLAPGVVTERIGVDYKTLRKWRETDEGPPWVALPGGLVRYPSDELEAWMADRKNSQPIAQPDTEGAA